MDSFIFGGVPDAEKFGERQNLHWDIWHFTGLHQERAYTCLGISCTQCIHHMALNAYTRDLWCTHLFC